MESGEKRRDCSHYGVDYTLGIQYSAESLSVTAEEKLTGLVWRGTFAADYIEEVTRKTGNYKRFPVYIKMLLAAMDGSSKSVLLELVSHQQMDALRAKKRSQPSSSSRPDSRLYLILTYSVEFDKVHYPLPLTQEELSPSEQGQVIRQLRLKIDSLTRLLPPQSLSALDLVHENAKLREELNQLSSDQDAKTVALRQELDAVKSKNQKQIAYLQKINGELRDELNKAKASMDAYVSEIKGREEPSDDLRAELEEVTEELHTTKEELKRYRDLYEESKQAQSELRSALDGIQGNYDFSREDAEEIPSVRSSHRRLFQDQEYETDEHFAASGDDIESRMQKIRELLQRQAII